MLVGFLIAVAASTGTKFRVPNPRYVDAGFFFSKAEMWLSWYISLSNRTVVKFNSYSLCL